MAYGSLFTDSIHRLGCRCCHSAKGTSSSSPAPSLFLGALPLAKTACALEFFLIFPFELVLGGGGGVADAERDRDGAPEVGAAGT